VERWNAVCFARVGCQQTCNSTSGQDRKTRMLIMYAIIRIGTTSKNCVRGYIYCSYFKEANETKSVVIPTPRQYYILLISAACYHEVGESQTGISSLLKVSDTRGVGHESSVLQ
jgi:hypothetical protein